MQPEIRHGISPLCGQTVEVINRGGDELAVEPFGGFLSLDEIQPPIDGVAITGIAAFTPDDPVLGEWFEYDKNDWMLGHRYRSSVYLVLCHNRPIRISHGKGDKYTKGNNISKLPVKN
jgi:hypothetical protein